MTTGEPRQLATVRSYDELLAALRARALELGATRKQIGFVAGLPDGYAATLLAPGPAKSLGRTSFGPMLGALGLALVVIEDAEALARVRHRLGNGQKSYMLNGGKNAPVIFKLSRKHMRKIAKLSAPARMKKMPKWKRSRVARQAARARWEKQRAAARAAGIAPAAARSGEAPARPPRSAAPGAPSRRAATRSRATPATGLEL